MKRMLGFAGVGLASAIFVGGAVAGEEIKLEHDGLTLNANLEKADGSWPAGPVVLMTHGTLAHRGLEIIEGLQGLLAERGLSSLGINLSLGIDDRAASMYDCPTPHRHLHTDAVGEIGAWVAWLKGQGAEQIVLLGHSRGGNQTARFAAQGSDPAVTTVVLVAPQTRDEQYESADYRERYGKPMEPLLKQAQDLAAEGKGDTMLEAVDFLYCPATRASAAAFASYYTPDPKMDTAYLIPSIQVPVLVIAGSEDSTAKGLTGKMKSLADGERVQFVVIDGADHFFRDLYSEDIADAVAELVEGG